MVSQTFCLINFSHSFFFSSEHRQSLLVSEHVPIKFLLRNKNPQQSKNVKKSIIKIVRKNSIIFKFYLVIRVNLRNRL